MWCLDTCLASYKCLEALKTRCVPQFSLSWREVKLGDVLHAMI